MNSEDAVIKLKNQALECLLIPPFWISKLKKIFQFFQKYNFCMLTSPNMLLFKCQLFNYLMNSEDTVRKLRNQTLKFLLIPPFWISKSKKSVQFFQKYHFFQTDIWKYNTVGVPNLKECKVLLVYCIKIKNVTF